MPQSESSQQDIGRKEGRCMKRKIKYTDEPVGNVKVVSDFLPSPEELALKDETVKVTIALSKASVEFFKKEARKNKTQYQRMIRRLLDEYATHQS
jgi:predicted DNA binding CopG/RHH family protein